MLMMRENCHLKLLLLKFLAATVTTEEVDETATSDIPCVIDQIPAKGYSCGNANFMKVTDNTDLVKCHLSCENLDGCTELKDIDNSKGICTLWTQCDNPTQHVVINKRTNVQKFLGVWAVTCETDAGDQPYPNAFTLQKDFSLSFLIWFPEAPTEQNKILWIGKKQDDGSVGSNRLAVSISQKENDIVLSIANEDVKIGNAQKWSEIEISQSRESETDFKYRVKVNGVTSIEKILTNVIEYDDAYLRVIDRKSTNIYIGDVQLNAHTNAVKDTDCVYEKEHGPDTLCSTPDEHTLDTFYDDIYDKISIDICAAHCFSNAKCDYFDYYSSLHLPEAYSDYCTLWTKCEDPQTVLQDVDRKYNGIYKLNCASERKTINKVKISFETVLPYHEAMKDKLSELYENSAKQVKDSLGPVLARTTDQNGGTSQIYAVDFRQSGETRQRRQTEVAKNAEADVEIHMTIEGTSTAKTEESLAKLLLKNLNDDHANGGVPVIPQGKVAIPFVELGQNYKDTEIPRDCVSDCWKYNPFSKDCDVKKDDEKCFNLQCNWDSVQIDFNSQLFGLVDDEKNAFSVKSDDFPIWSDGRWRSTCPLGNCNMNISTVELDGKTFLSFMHKIVVEDKARLISNEGVELDIFIDKVRSVEVTFECLYATEVKISSDVYDVFAVKAAGHAINFGSLDHGFTVNLFSDETLETLVKDINLYVGSTIFVQIKWQLKSLAQKLNFFVDKIDVGLNDKSLSIVKNNCYSGVFAAAPITPKLSSTVATMKFKSFILGNDSGSTKMQMKLVATVKVCTLDDDKCDVNLTISDDDCDQTNPEYVYKAHSSTTA